MRYKSRAHDALRRLGDTPEAYSVGMLPSSLTVLLLYLLSEPPTTRADRLEERRLPRGAQEMLKFPCLLAATLCPEAEHPTPDASWRASSLPTQGPQRPHKEKDATDCFYCRRQGRISETRGFHRILICRYSHFGPYSIAKGLEFQTASWMLAPKVVEAFVSRVQPVELPARHTWDRASILSTLLVDL